ncbi:MAG TPA: hypothetical protein VN754_10685 [Candidatus Binataceae bacterium]|nr:hypothetical protein [Candidatus Binataceae bacterium]
MAEPERRITVRRLPDGKTYDGFERGRRGALLDVELAPDTPALLGTGALVEVQSSTHIYLGEVQGVRGATLRISVEHIVDRAALAAIQQVWQGPK